jgi:hypothetical protein
MHNLFFNNKLTRSYSNGKNVSTEFTVQSMLLCASVKCQLLEQIH